MRSRSVKSLVMIAAAFLLCAVMTVAFPDSANAATEGYYTYTVSDGEATITSVDTKISGSITIPSTLGGYTVTTIGENAFRKCIYLTNVILPNSVTSIDCQAFYICGNLNSVTIPESVISIGSEAFYYCTNLTIYAKASSKPLGWSSSWNYSDYPVVWGYIASTGVSLDKTSVTLTEWGETIQLNAIVTPNGVPTNMVTWHSSNTMVAVVEANGVVRAGQNGTAVITATTTDNGFTATCEIKVDIVSQYMTYTVSNNETTITDVDTAISGSITIPSTLGGCTVTTIGENAFAKCNGLTSIIIPDTVTSIGDSAFYCCDSLTSVTIPDSVTNIGYQAFWGCINLTGIIIPDSVMSIGDEAFYSCKGLTNLIIPGSVIRIGSYAFANCNGLTDVFIEKGVTYICNYAFKDCTSLSSVSIPDSVNSIGYYAFQNCTGLTKVNITDIAAWCGISFSDFRANPLYYAKKLYVNDELITELVIPNIATCIGNYAFYGCSGLTGLDIPDTVTNIGDYAFSYCFALKNVSIGNGVASIGGFSFRNCTGLTSVTIGNGVTSIGNYAFENCSSLTSITIPDSVTSIGWDAFAGCSSLESMVLPFVGGSVKSESDTYQYPFGYIFGTLSYTGGVKTTQYYYGSSTSSTTSTTYYIPSGLKSVTITGGNILYGAFRNCSNLASINIGNRVTDIGERAFEDCSGLTDVIIGSNVKSIGDYAFFDCSGLTNITIPASVTSIGNYAFYDCSGLNSITIPASVTSIGDSAFSGCSSLESMVLPFVGGSVKSESDTYQYPFGYIFGTYSYTGGVAITQYYYGSSTSSTTSTTYYIPSGLKSVTITGGNILCGAFRNCSNLTSINIGNRVTGIGERAFEDCSGLTDVIIGSNVKSIGDYAFYDCSGLTNITIPVSVTSIGSYAFRNCSGLTSVTIGNGVTSIGNYAFEDCSGLTNITIPASVTSIGRYAFNNCSGLTSVTIDNGVTSIGDSVFYNCNGLTSITIPDSVTDIGDYAFYGCSSLKSITIPDSVTSIGDSVFYNCSGLTSVTIPDSVTSIGWDAFRGCSSLESMVLPFVGGSVKSESDTYQYPFGYIFGTSSYTGGVETRQFYYGSSASATTASTYYIPSSLKSVAITGGNILYGAFYNCSGLTSITISNSVTSIGEDAFYNCSGLTGVTIGSGVTSIGSSAFMNCSGLTNITIPDSVTGIGSGAFLGCSGLSSITIPDSVTSIGSYAFYNCSSLTNVTIPDSVTAIGDYAFDNCYNLTIYAEAMLQPTGWHTNWNPDNRPVVWGHIPSVGETVTGYNLTMQGSNGGDIGINLKMTLSDELLADSGAYVKMVIDGKESKIPLSELTYDSVSGKYSLTNTVAAKNMSTVITATVYNGAGECGASYTYSVKSYAEYILEHSSEYDAELVSMVKATLNYGAMAQKYFGYETETLANSSLSESDKAALGTVTSIDVADATYTGTVSSVGFAKHSASIVLGSETTIKHYITLANGENIENYIIKVNGVEVMPKRDGDRYCVSISNIAAADLDDGYVLSVERISDNATYTASYSAMNYVKAMFNACKNDPSKADLCNLMRAIYLYNSAANSYFGK